MYTGNKKTVMDWKQETLRDVFNESEWIVDRTKCLKTKRDDTEEKYLKQQRPEVIDSHDIPLPVRIWYIKTWTFKLSYMNEYYMIVLLQNNTQIWGRSVWSSSFVIRRIHVILMIPSSMQLIYLKEDKRQEVVSNKKHDNT